MAEMQANSTGASRLLEQFQAFSQIPMVRQLGALFGLAAAIALAASAVLWLQQPTWRQLEAGLPLQEQAQVLDALGAAGIEYSLGAAGSSILVPAERLYEARMALATSGLPAAPAEGYALLDQDAGLGASRRMESTRFRRALEGELARSVESLAGVQNARVHLAIPERSVFLRSQAEPSASVILTRYRGGQLSEGQIAGIQRLVAASVPELVVDKVAVLDPSGTLLSQDTTDRQAQLSSTQFSLKRELESDYVGRIQSILAPLLGADGLRAEVAAEIDFTTREVTREIYNPDGGPGALRSERAQRQRRPEGVGGVPGALTNAPPPGGVLEGGPAPAERAEGLAADELQADVTRNYELDKEIEYARPSPGQLMRLSIAVVVNALPEDAEGIRPARTEAQLAALEAIVRDAVGFNPNRGDTLTLREAPFLTVDAVPLPEPESEPFWSAPWFEGLLRQVLLGLALLALVLFVLRPFMKSVMTLPPPPNRPAMEDPVMQLSAPAALAGLPAPGSGAAAAMAQAVSAQQSAQMNQWLDDARGLAQEDPRRIAQLTRQWMNSDG